MEGRRLRMGSLNAIVFSCGTVTVYLTGVDEQRRPRPPQNGKLSPSPCANFPFLHTSLGNWNTGMNWMENGSEQAQTCSQS